jgi:hypothetical protein
MNKVIILIGSLALITIGLYALNIQTSEGNKEESLE